MKHLARILAVGALAASPLLAPAPASAQSYVPVPPSSYIPALGATFTSPGVGVPGAQIGFLYPNSPLRRMWSSTMGYFHADPGDYVISLNYRPIANRFDLIEAVSGQRGWVPITIRDARGGAEYRGSVLLP